MLPDPIDDDPQLPRHPHVTLVRERRCAFGEDLATLLVVAQDRARIVQLVSA